MVSGNLVLRIGMHRIMATAFVALSALSVCFALLLVWVGDGQLPLSAFLLWLVTILFFEGLAYGNIGALALESLGDNAGFGATVFGCFSTLLSVPIGISIGQAFDGTVAPLVFGYVIAPAVALALMWLDKGSPWRRESSPATRWFWPESIAEERQWQVAAIRHSLLGPSIASRSSSCS